MRLWVSGFWVWDCEFRVYGYGFGFWVLGLAFRVLGLGWAKRPAQK